MPIEVRRLLLNRSPASVMLRRIFAVGLALLLLWLLGQVVLLVFAAVLLAVLLAAPADWVRRHSRIGYGGCLALVLGAILLTLAAIGFALAPEVSAQIGQISDQLPPALHRVIGGFQTSTLGRVLLGQFKAGAGGAAASFAAPLLKSASSLVVALGSIVFVVFCGLYFAATPGAYERGLLRLVPSERCARVREIVEAVASTLKFFLFGRLISMCIIAACSMVGLWLLGIPAAIALGLLAGALSFVPYVGSAASGVAPFLLAYMRDPVSALYVIVLYVGIHVLDGYILVPLVQRRMVHLLPAMTLTAQLVLGILWGLLGIAVATPLAAALMTLIEMGYVEDLLHKPGELAGSARPMIAAAAPERALRPGENAHSN